MSKTVVIQQRDGEVIAVGPIPSTVTGTTWYDATGHTCTLVVKASSSDTDASGTTIVGALSGNTTVGFTATYTIPTAVTVTAGTKWMHAWITPAGGSPMTIAYRPLYVDAT